MPPDIQRAVLDLVGEAMASSARMEKAWCIICTDDESGKVVYVRGVYDEPEQALVAAGESVSRDKEQNPDEEYLWSYMVVPFVDKDEK